jgi:hypothetical protein
MCLIIEIQKDTPVLFVWIDVDVVAVPLFISSNLVLSRQTVRERLVNTQVADFYIKLLLPCQIQSNKNLSILTRILFAPSSLLYAGE